MGGQRCEEFSLNLSGSSGWLRGEITLRQRKYLFFWVIEILDKTRREDGPAVARRKCRVNLLLRGVMLAQDIEYWG